MCQTHPGQSNTASGYQHAFLWTAEAGMEDLGTLGGSYSYARGINALGQVVGESTPASGNSHAFLWTAQGGMEDLGTLGGSYSSAWGINDLGQVVGESTTAAGYGHAALWTPFFLVVTIDIKPGSDTNTINLGSEGVVPVAILSTASFDATTVNPTTVTLASAPVKLKGNGTPMASVEDVNGDGISDLVVQVETEALQLSETDTEAALGGLTYDGTAIWGTDSVQVVP